MNLRRHCDPIEELWMDFNLDRSSQLVWRSRRVESFATLILSEDKEQKCASEIVFEKLWFEEKNCTCVDFRLPQVYSLPQLPEIITFYHSLPDGYRKLQMIVEKASRGIFVMKIYKRVWEFVYSTRGSCNVFRNEISLDLWN